MKEKNRNPHNIDASLYNSISHSIQNTLSQCIVYDNSIENRPLIKIYSYSYFCIEKKTVCLTERESNMKNERENK